MLALGVVSDPSAWRRRSAARATWLRDPAIVAGQVDVRFVLGSGASEGAADDDTVCRNISVGAAQSETDVVLVPTPDCKMWHSPAKVHAWFQYALTHFPKASWIGKTEDDAMLWPSAVVADLRVLPADVDYFGVLAWQGSCRSLAVDADGQSAGPQVECSGCYGGPLAEGISMCRAAHCRAGGAAALGRRCCQVGCPRSMRMSPFAVGALDIRARPFAERVASCGYAQRYFSALSRFGQLLGAMCSTTDGAQGHAIGECALAAGPRHLLVVVDGGDRRLSDGIACRQIARAATSSTGSTSTANAGCGTGLTVLHPLKRQDVAGWMETWLGLTQPALRPLAHGSSSPRIAGTGTDAGSEIRGTHRRYSALPMAYAKVSAGADSRPPVLKLTGEMHGPAGPGNESLGVAWRRRWEYVTGVVNRHSSRMTSKTPDGVRTKRTVRVQRMRARRRLRLEPIWALNCTRLWAP